MDDYCEHVAAMVPVTPSADGCEDCLKIGDTWVHLRLCKNCGHVGCCDNSKNRHATKHFHATGHPMIESFELGARLVCYADDLFLNRRRRFNFKGIFMATSAEWHEDYDK